MYVRVMRIFATRSLYWLLLATVACGKTSGAGPDAGTTATSETVAATLDLDGYVLMLATDPNNTQIHLLDPATGKASQPVPLLNMAAPKTVFAVSPDGQRIAWITTQREIVVAETQWQDGAPAFHELRRFTGLFPDFVRWNLQGDRLHTAHVWLNPDTGDVSDCTANLKQPEETKYPIFPLPDGHLFACPQASSLMDDGRRVATANGTGEHTSADGQWYSSDLHVPTWTNRPLPPNQEVDQFFSQSPLKFALPDGRWGMFVGGIRGKYVVEEGSVQGSSVYVKKILTANDPLQDGQTWDVRDSFVDDKHAAVAIWKMQGVLEPFLSEGDGRSWVPLAISGDGHKMLWVITSWNITFSTLDGSPEQTTIASVVAEVDTAGQMRAFRVTDLGLQPAIFIELAATSSGRLELPNGDWLLPYGYQEGAWLGYLDGKPVTIGSGGVLVQGGTLLLRSTFTDGKFAVCARKIDKSAVLPADCFLQPNPGSPVAMMAQGTRASHQGDAPLLLSATRRAAWTGSVVHLYGAHFGTAGKLTVGEVEVPQTAIGQWSDRHIAFTMVEALPDDGVLHVTTAAGTAGLTQQFRLARTKPWNSPFEKASHELHSVQQGLNVVDLGDLATYAGTHQPDLVLDPAAKLADGKFVVWSQGASPEKTKEMLLKSGPYQFLLAITLQDAIAKTDAWQMPLLVNGDLASQHPAFVTIAGDLVERQSAMHPVLGQRTSFRTATSPTGQGNGLPQSWQEIPGGALAVSHVDGLPDNTGWGLAKLTGWIGADGLWGTAQYAPGSNVNLPTFFQGAVAEGNTVISVGADPLGMGGAAWQVSLDGGKTFGATQLAGSLAPQSQALQYPLLVQAKSGSFVLVLDASHSAPQLLAVHALSLDGVLTPNVAQLPPETLINGGTVKTAPLSTTSHQGRALLHFQSQQTLAMIDFDQPGTAPRPWTVLPDAASKGHVASYWHDPQSHDLLVVLDNGQVQKATAANGWTDFTPLDLGLKLSLPGVVKPLALGKLVDGRWIVLAQLLGSDGKTVSPLGPIAWLVGGAP
jgi:hypothetical protein